MAIQDLVNERVDVGYNAGGNKSMAGTLQAVDDKGVMFTGEDRDGPFKVFLPWSVILWVRSAREQEDKGPKEPQRSTRFVR
jgi:hypothetical protein